MAMTAGGLPYPVGTDAVVQGDDAIKALAEAVGSRLASGLTGATSDGNGMVFAPAGFAGRTAIAWPAVPSRIYIFPLNSMTATGAWFQVYPIADAGGGPAVSVAVAFYWLVIG
jgi:hypothetical protein